MSCLRFAIQFLFVLLLVAANSAVYAALPTSFDVRTTITLCPEYGVRPIALDIYYSVGETNQFAPANVVSLSINDSTKVATVVVRLPTDMGSTPFKISAHCRDPLASSAPSNIVSVSNCDALAKLDTDGDGLNNNAEDTNCNQTYDLGDKSNPYYVDSDGDGAKDLFEVVNNTDPADASSSSFRTIFSGAPFDPDENGTSNPVVFRPQAGAWFIKDFPQADSTTTFQFGRAGDVPFVYQPKDAPSDVGVLRSNDGQYTWLFNGPGLLSSSSQRLNSLSFGQFGDILALASWEEAGVTSPAIERIVGEAWNFIIYNRDGSARTVALGQIGDVSRPGDYDGDGLTDAAVFRPSELKTIVRRSSDNQLANYTFGSASAEYTLRGDITGDGIEDVSFWEPVSGLFFAMKSDSEFNSTLAQAHNVSAYTELQLGIYGEHLPLNFNFQNNKNIFTVINHKTAERFFRANNDPNAPVTSVSFGLFGDHQG